MLVYGALSSHRQTDPAKFILPLFGPRLIYSTATISRVVASALGAFPAARRNARSDERSAHDVVERSAYGASDCAVFIQGLSGGSAPSRW